MAQQFSTANSSAATANFIPMTEAAFREMEAEIERLTVGIAEARSAALDAQTGSDAETPMMAVSGELHVLTQRRDALRATLASARVSDNTGAAVVGSRVTVEDTDGESDTYVLVPPGSGDPRAGRVSPESPLGAALLGRRAGEEVDVIAPAGTWSATIVTVE
ncbi:MAG: GreA/GreB family elongation factor [Chloroflexi bacterium]|nr:GreA/GreB family elongation factor [Chloroflexota bacterium]